MIADAGYDPATKLWTTILGVMVAALIDWPSVLLAHEHENEPATGWWAIAVMVAVAAPGSWLGGHVGRRTYEGAVVWFCVTGTIVGAQLAALVWGRG